jgi:hypothetical protein
MANNTRVEPVFLDTAGSPIVIRNGLNLFKTVRWVNPLTAGDRAYLYDSAGAVVCDFTCVFPGENIEETLEIPFTGPFTLSQLDSGYLLITRV